MSVDPDFAVVAAGVVGALVAVVIFLRWRARCPSCGAWGQTLSCERCGAVNDPFAPTPTLPAMRQSEARPPATFERSPRVPRPVATRAQAAGELESFKALKDILESKGLKGIKAGVEKLHGAKTPDEARAALMAQMKPLLGVVEKVHVFTAAVAVFIFVSALPRVSMKVALIAAVAAGILVKRAKGKAKGARRCPSCGALGDPTAVHCASCGKEKRLG